MTYPFTSSHHCPLRVFISDAEKKLLSRVLFSFSSGKETFSSRANSEVAPSYNQDEQPCQISTPKVIYGSSEQTHTACRLLWITSWSASLHGPNTFLHVTVKYADKWIKTRRIGIRTEGKQSCRWVNFSQPNQPNPQDTPTLSISDGRKQGEKKQITAGLSQLFAQKKIKI